MVLYPSFLILGKNFALKTLISTVIYPPFIALFSKLTSPDVLDGVFCLKNSPHGDIVLLISALFGGVLIGFGCALTFIGGGSTGGTDIIGRIIQTKMSYIPIGKMLLFVDGIIIVVSLIVFKNIELTLYGIMALLISTFSIDFALLIFSADLS